MALWDQIRQRTAEAGDQLRTKAGQFRNKDFADASMAMCALIAAADGTIDADERRKVAGFIGSNEALSVFPIAELQEKFSSSCAKLEADYDFGKIEALQVLGRVRSKPDQARAVAAVGVVIGAADGDFDADEKRALREGCHALGVDPAEFDV